MPSRYVTLGVHEHDEHRETANDWQHGPSTRMVAVQERRPVNTGLLDELGVPLFRVDTPEPVGFRPRRP